MPVPWRRIAVTALLAVATFGSLAAALDPSEPQPASGPAITVPFPQVGDRGTYAWEPGSTLDMRQDFEWVGPHEFPGPTGVQMAQGVRVTGVDRYLAHPDNDFRSWQRIDSIYGFAGAGMVGHEQWTFSNDTEPTSQSFDIDQDTPGQQWMQDVRHYGTAQAHCLFRSPLQGSVVTSAVAAWAQSPCNLGGVAAFDGRAMAWSWTGIEDIDGVAALRLHGEGPRELSVDRVHSVDVWLADGLAYPVRVAWDGSFPGRVDLVAFEPGSGPAAVDSTYAPAVQPSPLPLASGPRTAAFLDDSGVDHPFTISEAIALAEADPSDEFRQFMADEPSAYLYWADEDSNGDALGWYLQFRGEVESFRLNVWKGPTSVPFTPAVPQVGVDYPEVVYSMGREPHRPGTVPPSQVPTHVPTVAGLLAAWETATQAGGTSEKGGSQVTPSWGFAYVCSDLDQLDLDTYYAMLGAKFRDPCVPSLYTWAGQRAASEVTEQNAVGEPMLPWSISWLVTQDGAAAYTIEGLYGHQAERKPPLNVTLASPSDGASVVGGAGGPTFLSPPAAASAGAAAFLVAAAYWFWPSLKSGAAALFSRIQGSDVLQHPKRELLLDVIRGSPGIRFRNLARESGLPNGALIHHLRKLEDAELIRTIRMKRYLAYVAKGTPTPVGTHPALDSESARRLVHLIDATPGINLREAAKAAGLSPATTHYHLRRLMDAKFVTVEKHGRSNRLLPGENRLRSPTGAGIPGLQGAASGPDTDAGATSPAAS